MSTYETAIDRTPSRRPHRSPFGQAVDAMRVTAQTPNQQVFGEVRGWYDIRVSLAPGYPRRAGDREVETQLTRLARLLFTNRTREYYALLRKHLEPDPFQLERRRSKFEAALEGEVVRGTGAQGAIEVTSVGMRLWTVSLATGTVDSLTAEELGTETTLAANRLAAEWLGVLAAYKRERWDRER